MTTSIHPALHMHCPLPSLKFQRPNQFIQNQETTKIFSLSELRIQLECDIIHHLFEAFNQNTPLHSFSYDQTMTQSCVYLQSDYLDQDLKTVLKNWNIPETHHEYILHSINEQAYEVLDTFDETSLYHKLTTSIQLHVNVRCNKYYFPNVNIMEEWTSLYEQEESDDDDDEDEDEDEDEDDDGMIPASESSIKSMVMRKRKREEIDDEQGESTGCSICLEEYLDGSIMGYMPCSHMFHEKCITNWLRKSHVCPLCRFRMPTGSNNV